MTIYALRKADLSIEPKSKRWVKRDLSGHYQDVDLIFCALMDGHVVETPTNVYAIKRHKLEEILQCQP